MRPSFPRAFVILFAAASLGAGAFALDGCSSDDKTDTGGAADATATDSPTGDAASDNAAPIPDGGGDANCPQAIIKPATGETCVGFGKGSPCDVGCGLPPYGYLCFVGGPPGFTGCSQVSSTSFGDTYCCPKNDCVAEPDQDKLCNSTAATPHRFQCPPTESGGNATPPAGCVDGGPGGSKLEVFYCCP